MKHVDTHISLVLYNEPRVETENFNSTDNDAEYVACKICW